MDKKLIIEGVIAIVLGFISQNSKFITALIKAVNKVQGIKSEISEMTIKYQKIAGILLIIIGFISIYMGIVK